MMGRLIRLIICKCCGKEGVRYAKGLRKQCYMRQWREGHREERLAYARCYYKEHRDEFLAQWRNYYRENRDKILAYGRRHGKANRDKGRIRLRRWRRENPEKVRIHLAHRRAHKRNVANTLTPEQIEFERKVGEATYPGQELHMHHLVPLSKGGGHAWGNIAFIPASLNLSINDRLPEEVYKQGAFL